MNQFDKLRVNGERSPERSEGQNRTMRKMIIIGIGLMISLGLIVDTPRAVMVDEDAAPGQLKKEEKPKYAPGEIIVKFRSGEDMLKKGKGEGLEKTFKNKVKENYNMTGGKSLKITGKELKGMKLPKKIHDLIDEDRSFAEPVFKGLHRRMHRTGKSEAELNEETFKKFSQKRKMPVKGPKNYHLSNAYIFKEIDTQGKTIEEIAEELSLDPNIEYAQPNYRMELYGFPDELPDDTYVDPDRDGQWSTGAWEQDYEDMWGLKKIQCEEAWKLSQGEGIVVAVIDTGVDYNHPDLAENIWINEAELYGITGEDDDHNEYIDDIRGWDFAGGEEVEDNDPMDYVGHGTHCAGTIAAVGNNGIGVIGVAPKAKIMALKAGGENGLWTVDTVQAISYAVINGASILSCSWGYEGPVEDKALYDAIGEAHDNFGCVIVTAAGNLNSEYIYPPAVYEETIAVASTNPDDKKTGFSQYSNLVDVSAPGGSAWEIDSVSELWSIVKDSIYALIPGDRPSDKEREARGHLKVAVTERVFDCILQKMKKDETIKKLKEQVYNELTTGTDVEKGYGLTYVYEVDVEKLLGEIYDWGMEDQKGFNILSTSPDVLDKRIPLRSVSPGYHRWRGTSMACPHVSGVAALILSQHPEYSNEEVRKQLINSGNNIDYINPEYKGKLGKRVNAYAALTYTPIPTPPEESTIQFDIDEKYQQRPLDLDTWDFVTHDGYAPASYETEGVSITYLESHKDNENVFSSLVTKESISLDVDAIYLFEVECKFIPEADGKMPQFRLRVYSEDMQSEAVMILCDYEKKSSDFGLEPEIIPKNMWKRYRSYFKVPSHYTQIKPASTADCLVAFDIVNIQSKDNLIHGGKIYLREFRIFKSYDVDIFYSPQVSDLSLWSFIDHTAEGYSIPGHNPDGSTELELWVSDDEGDPNLNYGTFFSPNPLYTKCPGVPIRLNDSILYRMRANISSTESDVKNVPEFRLSTTSLDLKFTARVDYKSLDEKSLSPTTSGERYDLYYEGPYSGIQDYIAFLDLLNIKDSLKFPELPGTGIKLEELSIGGANLSINSPLPFAPSSLVATPISSHQVDLSWQDNSDNEDGFKIERKEGASDTYHEVATVGADVDSYNDKGLSPEATYTYKIRAYNCWGDSIYSNTSSAITPSLIPNTPLHLTATAISRLQIDLTWMDNSINEDGFKIERSTNGVDYTQIATVGADVDSYNDKGLSPEATYTYRIRAYNAFGDSDYSNESIIYLPSSPPNAPSNLRAETTPYAIYLYWQDESNNEDGFKIERKTDSTDWKQIAMVCTNMTFYCDNNNDSYLFSPGTYYYQVRAWNIIGDSSNSNELLVNIAADLPSAPSDLTATVITPTEIHLSWRDNSDNEDGFGISRKEQRVDQHEYYNYKMIMVDANMTTYNDTDVSSGNKYDYSIAAYNFRGGSSAVGTTVWTSTPPLPEAPSNLSTKAISTSKIYLNWQDNSNIEEGYKIERSTDGVNWHEITKVGGDVITYSDLSVSVGNTYHYRVKAYNKFGNSGYSNEASVSIPLFAPYYLEAVASQDTLAITLTWNDTSSGEDGFEIYRKPSGGTYSLIKTITWPENDGKISGTGQRTYTDEYNLTGQTEYFYKIRAYRGSEFSGYTNEDSATTMYTGEYSGEYSGGGEIYFEAEYEYYNNRVKLHWYTYDIENIQTFTIERSMDGEGWEPLYECYAHQYITYDYYISSYTTYYYRITLYDLYGSSYLSEVVEVYTSGEY